MMFPVMEDEGVRLRLKPMNCPSHMTLFNQQLHSYRELPLRYAEFATLYRYERRAGESLTRVRSLTQDDCHIFCTEEQIGDEFGRALDLITEILDTYGFTDYYIQLSLRGDEASTLRTTKSGHEPSRRCEMRWTPRASPMSCNERGGLLRPEGRLHGQGRARPRVALNDPGRLHSAGAPRLRVHRRRRTAAHAGRHPPRRAGSTERFMGVLIEHFMSAFPVWLAPIQAVVIPIADRHVEFAEQVGARLREAGIRAEVDTGGERMQNKIRQAQNLKVPYMLVVGDKEIEADAVAVRLRSGENLGAVGIASFIALSTVIGSRSLELQP